jgi:hypothetical protein
MKNPEKITSPIGIRPRTHYLLFVIVLFIFSYCKTKDAPAPGDVLEVTTFQLQPDIYFHQAITEFTNRNFDVAAENIRLAIKTMDSISQQAPEEQKILLKNSIDELNALQTNVAYDKVDGIEDLNYFFARAGQALAGYHMHIYKTEYYNMEGKKAADELKKAITFIETSVEFNDHEFDAEELSLIDKIKSQIDLLKEGEDVTKEEIEALLGELNSHMNKWGNEIEVNYRKFQDTQKAVITQ